ncbi:MAG: hypothetical protein L0215_20290 [Gemmataceae bacterium]|nr:hypothetical protein [Gemmataceae bacterium]
MIVTVLDKAKIRTMPPPDLDDKGKPKPFKSDKKDPDWKLGGIKGTLKDLAAEQWVIVGLSGTPTGSKHVTNMIWVLGEEETPAKPATKSPNSSKKP